MRARTRLALFFGLLAAIVAPLPAHAVIDSTCGGTFNGANQCTFFAAGSFFFLQGHTSGASIAVWVTDATGALPIFSCGANGGSNETCTASNGGDNQTPTLVGLPIGVPLTCHVSGIGSGTYSCYTWDL